MRIFLPLIVFVALGLLFDKPILFAISLLIGIIAIVMGSRKSSGEFNSADQRPDASIGEVEDNMETQKVKQIPKQVTIAINLMLTVLLVTIVGQLMDFSHAIATEKDTPYWVHVASIPINVVITLFLVYKIYPGRNWARWLYLIVVAPNALAVLGVGEVFQRSQPLGVAYVAVGVLSCAIVFMLFFSPGKLWFQKRDSGAQTDNQIDSSEIDVTGQAHAGNVNSNELSMTALAAASEATTSADLDESWKQFESGVKASQQLPPSYRTSEDRKTTPGSEVKKKQWMPSAILAAGVLGFLLFFHIVPAHLVIFPKQVPSFANTFVDIDDYLKQYNAANFIGQIALSQTYLHQQLIAKGLLVSTAKN